MAWKKTRVDFVATETQWRRLVGEVTVGHNRRSEDGQPYDYMALYRICSRESAPRVAADLMAVALRDDAYMTCNIHGDHVGFSLGVVCEEVDAVEAGDCEPTLEMAVVP